jgi:hypothetical protein
MRTTLGILIGILLAACALAGFGYLLMQLHPLPAGFQPLSLRQLSDYVDGAPRGALAVICIAAGVAALIGAWPAARIARGHRGAAALVIGAPLTLLVIVGATLVPQPEWVPVLGMLLPIPLAVAGWRMAIPRAEV